MGKYSIIPIVLLAINEAIKKAGVPSRFIPLVNVVGGMIGGLLIEWSDTGKISPTGFMAGIIAGTSSGGIYDIKKILK